MGFIYWLLCGLIAGSLAKMITPQKESSSWVTSLIIGIIGGFVGGWLGSLIGISSNGFIMSLITATGGAVLVLFIYHKFIANK